LQDEAILILLKKTATISGVRNVVSRQDSEYLNVAIDVRYSNHSFLFYFFFVLLSIILKFFRHFDQYNLSN